MILSVDLVKSEIARYWAAFINKDAAALSSFYAHESLGFSSTAKRSEPGRMAAIRRDREYFGNEEKIQATVEAIEVVMIGESVAVAAYTFEFHASRTTGLGMVVNEDILDGRATQVFGFDPEGRVRIFHEHFSQPSS